MASVQLVIRYNHIFYVIFVIDKTAIKGRFFCFGIHDEKNDDDEENGVEENHLEGERPMMLEG